MMDSRASGLVEYRTRTCLPSLWAYARLGAATCARAMLSANIPGRSEQRSDRRGTLTYQSSAAVIFNRRGVRTVSGCSHGPPGTKVLLYVSTAFELTTL